MINIPTELLRTLIAVVDLRSFTKAAQLLGVTQPAVSAQIKRLQILLGAELLDKSAPGVSLTRAGDAVVAHGRRLLSINDQILDLAFPNAMATTLRLGVNGDFAASAVSRSLAAHRESHSELSFSLKSGGIDMLLRDMREGELDVVLGLFPSAPDSPHCWSDEMVWVRGPSWQFDPAKPLPLVSYGDECLFHRTAVEALAKAGIRSTLVYCGSSIAGLSGAVVAGLGVMVLPRSRVELPGLAVCEDARLPKLPEAFLAVYIRDGIGYEIRERAASAIMQTLRPRVHATVGAS